MLSPLMIFTNFHKVPVAFIDFGECLNPPVNFFVELELDFLKNKVSQCFLNIESVLKKDKYFAKSFDVFSNHPNFHNDNNIYIIEEDEEKHFYENNFEKNDAQKIEALLNVSDDDHENSEELENSEDEDYFKKLEEKADEN